MPSPTSNLLSYAHQLPTDDPDDDDEIDNLDDSVLNAIEDEEEGNDDGDVEMSDVTIVKTIHSPVKNPIH